MKGFCAQVDLFDFFNLADSSLGISCLPAENLREFVTVRDPDRYREKPQSRLQDRPSG
jgi:hypothetical protein